MINSVVFEVNRYHLKHIWRIVLGGNGCLNEGIGLRVYANFTRLLFFVLHFIDDC